MTSKERFLTAMTGGVPDRVPCTPDFSNMIPCRLTGRAFWDIYLHNDPPLWRAYVDAANYFGIDAWFFNGALDYEYRGGPQASCDSRIVSRSDERIVQRTRIRTPEGELEHETTYYRDNPPTRTAGPIKDFQKQFKFFKYLMCPPTGYRTDTARRQKQYVGPDHAFGACIGFPGFQGWMHDLDGKMEAMAAALADCPELLDELRDMQEKAILKQAEMIIDSKLFEHVLLGGSGAITLASPALFDRYAFPTIQKLTRMFKQAGLATMLHSCGKEMHIVQRCAQDSDLNCINPLEIAPMGDCDLAQVKRLYGDRIALMGNLHTTDVMLRGSVEQVRSAARQAIDDAGKGGGFILSTGDQCGRDTPDENIRALVEVCQSYGRYD